METLYYCGIDLHTKQCHLCIIDQEGNRVDEVRMKNDLAGILKFLAPYGQGLRIAVESTINWYWLVDGLKENGYDVTLAHSAGLSLITGAKVKTDRRDAFKLARLLRMGEMTEAYVYPVEQRPVRDLARRRDDLVAERAGLYVRLRALFMQYNVNTMGLNALKAMTVDEVNALALPAEAKLYASLFLERLPLISEQIVKIEANLSAKDTAAVCLLMTIPGIGPVFARSIALEVGDIDRFATEKHFCSYARLFPGTSESAGKARRGRRAKEGNPYLKCAFMNAAKIASAYVPEIKALKEKHAKRRGGKALRGNAVIAHRLGVAAYHMLKTGCVFDQEQFIRGKSSKATAMPSA
ncbi:MAG: IS110 family transposase [Actinomycetota bacterium]|nr:IS110 family transposase [Actinomycetota bacterium]